MSKENAWMEDRVTVKFINLQRPGDDIYIGCQGIAYQIKDGATVTVPRLVVEVAKDAVMTKYKVEGQMGGTKTQSMVKQARFMVVPIDVPAEPTKEESKKRAVIADIKKIDSDDDED